MRKGLLVLLGAVFLLTGLVGVSQADLVTIGTATYDGLERNLIWDDDNNGNSVVWLDYTKAANSWAGQKMWAAGLGVSLTYTIDPDAYTVDWGSNSWRLPSAGTTPASGYNQTTSEMGHLYYTELGNLGYYDTNGDYVGDGNWGLNNTGDFENLFSYEYWSGTEDINSNMWVFHMNGGFQRTAYAASDRYGLAIRTGQVSVVPIPGAIWLLGSGLIGLAALRRRKQGNRR